MTHRVKGGEKGQMPFEPTKDDRELVGMLAGNGIPHRIVARFIKNPTTGEHIGFNTLKRQFKEELKHGRAQSDALLIKTAFNMATVQFIPSVLIFMLKTRLGWKEPAVDPLMTETYADLVRESAKVHKPPSSPPELKVVGGSGQPD